VDGAEEAAPSLLAKSAGHLEGIVMEALQIRGKNDPLLFPEHHTSS